MVAIIVEANPNVYRIFWILHVIPQRYTLGEVLQEVNVSM